MSMTSVAASHSSVNSSLDGITDIAMSMTSVAASHCSVNSSLDGITDIAMDSTDSFNLNDEIANNVFQDGQNVDNELIDDTNCIGVEVSTQTDMTMEAIYQLEMVQQQCTEELCSLKNKLASHTFTEETFVNDEKKVLYYTGLSHVTILLGVFNLVESFLKPKVILSKFQQMIITLIHLRLNTDFTDLAYRFNCSRRTISRCFYECLSVLHIRLSSFVYWPDNFRENLPKIFRENFGSRVAVIIDCFEIRIERPANALALAQTWSNYKHANTIKFLIGISPHGMITFISSAWGGRASDKHIVENSGILEKLLPGDIILADRGFNIENQVNLYCAEVKIPAFTKGKKQLSPLEIESSRRISHLRIHVERVIGVLKQKYRILESVVPIVCISKSSEDEKKIIDEIITVACALTNLCPAVIPMD